MMSFRKSWPVSLLNLLGCLAMPAVADEPIREQFAYSIPVQIPGEAGLVKIDVPRAVYRESVQPGLRDLRVLNGAGEVVPFALRAPEPAVRAMPTTLRLPLFPLRGEAAVSGAALQLRIDGGKTSIELDGAPPAAEAAKVSGYLVVAENLENAVDALSFGWPEQTEDFASNLVIAASDDLANWRVLVSRGPVARLRQAGAVFEQRTVPIPATRARFFRVSAEAGSELPPLVSADATLVMASVPVERLTAEAAGVAVPGEAGVYEFDLGAQLPVDRVTLSLPDVNTIAMVEYYTRRRSTDAWRLVVSASVYRLRTTNGEIRSPPEIVSAEPARQWRVVVDQRGGGIGGGTPRLVAGWLPDQLVFVTRGRGPFEIVYGNAETADTPDGEVPLERLVGAGGGSGAALIADLPQALAGEPRDAGGPGRLLPSPPPKPWRIWILWAALLAGVATLGVLAWSLARQMRAAD
jgi:hypothetical protein